MDLEWTLNPMTGVFMREEQFVTQRHRRKDYVTMKAEMEVCFHKPENITVTPEAGRGIKGYCPRALRGNVVLPTP